MTSKAAAFSVSRSLSPKPACAKLSLVFSTKSGAMVKAMRAQALSYHGFERLRLRALSGARDEFHLAAIVQNLKALAGRLIRPPPAAAFA